MTKTNKQDTNGKTAAILKNATETRLVQCIRIKNNLQQNMSNARMSAMRTAYMHATTI